MPGCNLAPPNDERSGLKVVDGELQGVYMADAAGVVPIYALIKAKAPII